MRPSVREIAQGKWRGILARLGFSEKQLSGKHTACPSCGGVDRFRWDDKGGNGTFFCSRCGAGTGIDLVMRVKGCDFRTAAIEIERVAGFVKPEALKAARSDDGKVRSLRRVWKESFPVTDGDPVSKYLKGRKLIVPQSSVLRYHPDLTYRDGERLLGKFHAMLALVQAPDGSGATLHRTYLNFEGSKASVPAVKKLMPGLPLSGAAVRLFSPDGHVGVSEGIETAISASVLFSVPVWSVLSTAGMVSFVPPSGIRKVTVFSDNDSTLAGQKAAYTLAARLSAEGYEVTVEIPPMEGDWNDVLIQSPAQTQSSS